MTRSILAFQLPLASCLCLAMTGCTLNSTSTSSSESGVALQGRVMGGQQPIVGARIYLFAANTTGYGGPGIPVSNSNASVSLLSGTGNSDSLGSYVLSDSNGNFSITGDYTCTPNAQVYAYALGGNAGGGANSSSGLLAALGNCPNSGNFQSTTPFIFMDEVSTIAAAYSLAGFASDVTHISSSGTALAQAGIQNAFANAANLANLSTGTALATTPAGNGAVPQKQINTLANILSSCINSTGAIVGPTNPTTCYTLFNNAESNGSSGIIPLDTATAAINIAHNPGTNTFALFNLSPTTPPFQPSQISQPNDLTLAISFTGGGIDIPFDIAIDGSGKVWIANSANNSVSELANSGASISPPAGYTGGGLANSRGVAVDPAGNVWVSNFGGSLSELSNSGVAISPSPGFTGGGLSQPLGIAIDGTGGVWVANSTGSGISKFSNSGVAISPSTGFGIQGLKYYGVAIDGSGNVWATQTLTNAVVELSNSGSAIAPGNGFTGGFLSSSPPQGIAIDSGGYAWTADAQGGITKFSSSGTATGYVGSVLGGVPDGIAIDGAGNAWITAFNGSVTALSNTGTVLFPYNGFITGGALSSGGQRAVAIDGSGNIWVTGGLNVIEFVGAGVPVVTPLAVAVKNKILGGRP